MPAYRRSYFCVDCGEWTTRRRNTDESNICGPCGIARLTRTARELHSRSGPAWDLHRQNPGGRPRKATPDV